TISVGPSFYNTILAPFIFIFLILMGIGPMMKWGKNILLSQKKIIFFTIIGSFALSAAIIFLANKKNLILFLGLLSSIYLMISILIENIKNREFFKPYYLPKNLAHFGFALLIFSIFLNSHFSLSKNFEIKDKETIKFNDISIKLNNRQLKQESNFYEMIANFEVKKNNFIFNLNPSVRKFFQPNQITSETSIVSRMFSDHYIVVNFQDRTSDVLGVRYYFN
ncbi:MAG: cytochrome c-type biogenesis CcmF C-terminal domain-containing protein, partial [Pelagibacteraceae bacterium]